MIKAFFSQCNLFGFADAFGRNGEDKGERVEKVPVEDKPNTRVALGISVSFSIKGVCGELKVPALANRQVLRHEVCVGPREGLRNRLTSTKYASDPCQAAETGVDRGGRWKLW